MSVARSKCFPWAQAAMNFGVARSIGLETLREWNVDLPVRVIGSKANLIPSQDHASTMLKSLRTVSLDSPGMSPIFRKKSIWALDWSWEWTVRMKAAARIELIRRKARDF